MIRSIDFTLYTPYSPIIIFIDQPITAFKRKVSKLADLLPKIRFDPMPEPFRLYERSLKTFKNTASVVMNSQTACN